MVRKANDMLELMTNLSPERRALLALRLRKQRGDVSKERTIPRIPREEGPNSFPLSFAQERLWFLDQLEPGSSVYNAGFAQRLIGTLNREALEQSINEIVRRHEVLRTTFVAVDGRPAQVIVPTSRFRLPMVDLGEISEGKQETKVRQLAVEEAQRPFDLARGPLVRGALLRLGEAEHVLLLTMYHIISDGWSAGVFVRELTALYEAFSTGKPSPLPELPIQYADYAIWQREWLQGEVLEEQLAYWRERLAGMPEVLELPSDRPRPAMPTFEGASETFALSETVTEALRVLSRREGVTLFMTLLAAFQALLYRYTGQEDIVVGSPIANRNRAEIEGLIGFFVNMLVLRTDLSGDPTFCELLGQVREVALGAYTHPDVPFAMLVEALKPKRDINRNPLIQVTLALENVPMDSFELPGLAWTTVEHGIASLDVDLALSMRETEQGLVGVLEYSTDLFNSTAMSQMLEHFQNILEVISANPELRLLDIPLTKDEKDDVSEETSNLCDVVAEQFSFHL